MPWFGWLAVGVGGAVVVGIGGFAFVLWALQGWGNQDR